VEWVQTTGRTVEQAKDAALDQLGVDEQDAEFEVLEEPRPGLFGRLRGEARVRARVAPKPAPPKQDRRERRRRSGRGKSEAEPSRADGGGRSGGGNSGGGGRGRSRQAREPSRANPNPQPVANPSPQEESPVQEPVSVQAQADIMAEFLGGLVEAFGLEGAIERQEVDEETIELNVDGSDLGLLIGPKGQTLGAVQELARTAAQRRAPGPHQGRVRVDVGGYRQRRREALERFTQQLALDVQRSGQQKALEPMGAADRKVVHDTINLIEGVSTVSTGEEPRRRVIIVPATD
jgi:spoIIIJ-associated protein